MFKFQAIIFALFSVLASIGSLKCQTKADEKLLTQLEEKLDLDSSQFFSIESVFINYAFHLDSINTLIKSIQTSSIPENEISKKTGVLFKERKNLGIWKKEQLTSFLTAEQKVLYEKEIVAKSRPVLHYGHDKANCNACKKPGEPGYVPPMLGKPE